MTATDVYYNPYDYVIDADPYPVWQRLRDEAPVYYNEKHDFWALSRYDDVLRGLLDHAQDAISFKDAAGRFVRLNGRKAALLGHDVAAVQLRLPDLNVMQTRFIKPPGFNA